MTHKTKSILSLIIILLSVLITLLLPAILGIFYLITSLIWFIIEYTRELLGYNIIVWDWHNMDSEDIGLLFVLLMCYGLVSLLWPYMVAIKITKKLLDYNKIHS